MSQTTDCSWKQTQQSGWQAYLSVNMMILFASSLCLRSSFLNRLIFWPPPAWLRTSPPSHFSPRPNTCKQPHSCTYSLRARPHRYSNTSAKYNVTPCLNSGYDKSLNHKSPPWSSYTAHTIIQLIVFLLHAETRTANKPMTITSATTRALKITIFWFWHLVTSKKW